MAHLTPRLFTYRLRYDDGAAPNPFGGTCTLVICKPRIRKHAREGDWVAGTGAVTSGLPDAAHRLVYAMKVTKQMSMEDYDRYAKRSLPVKTPDPRSRDPHRRIGDAIYDFSTNPPRVRDGVHGEKNRETDLSGRFALLSDHFFYFGRNAVALPEDLCPIVKEGQGEKSNANAPYFDRFVEWIEALGYPPGSVLGDPITWPPTPSSMKACAKGRLREDVY